MSHFSPTLRPPAYRLTLLQRLQAVLSQFATALFPCRHQHATWPFEDRQRCIDCGAWRYYAFREDGSIAKGDWHPGGTGRDRASLQPQPISSFRAEPETAARFEYRIPGGAFGPAPDRQRR